MAYNRDNGNTLNEEQIASFLADAVSKVETASEAEIQTLNAIKKLFKKAVPFSRRMYVAAWLVRQVTSHGRSGRLDRFSRDRDRSEHFERRPERSYERNPRSDYQEKSQPGTERPERPPRVQIDPSVSTTIFVSIGRNRRVNARDLVGLLVSVAGLERERIGSIRILANYSFIQLFTDDCEKTIAALNGYDYRGRKLNVSYSRQHGEGDTEDAEGAAETNVSAKNDSVPAQERTESNATVASHGSEAKAGAEQKPSAETASASQPVTSTSSVASFDKPFSETTDDGQVKSHFGNGAAY